MAYDQLGAETLSFTLSFVLRFRQPLGIEHLGPLCDPLLGRHWPIGDDVVAGFTVNLVNVTPFAGTSVLEPEATCAEIWWLPVPADCEPVQAVHDTMRSFGVVGVVSTCTSCPADPTPPVPLQVTRTSIAPSMARRRVTPSDVSSC